MKIFVASFNRASDGALEKLIKMMKKENYYTDDYKKADYILAVGDREETFDFVLERYRENVPIIHLWAGEKSDFELHDDVYRHAMSLMSEIQLCTNDDSKNIVKKLCKSVGKIYKTIVVGNVMLDNMEIDETLVPKGNYDLVLYNPPTRGTVELVKQELTGIMEELAKSTLNKNRKYSHVWIEPNGDKYSDVVNEMVTLKTVPRPQFLGLLKNCNKFITNSSCAYYEAPFLIDKDKIIHIGARNVNRNSKFANMSIKNANENIMKLFRWLDEHSDNISTR